MLRVQYDAIVVGSSPLLMLAAIRLRRAGKNVLIIERSGALGGAWKIDQQLIDERRLLHECACHLIEWYAGGYEILEDWSSYPFVPLVPQPVKIWRAGRVRSYTSKLGILFEYFRYLRMAAIQLARFTLACLGVGKRSREYYRGSFDVSLKRILFASKYRLPGLVRFDAVRGPKGGFAKYVDHLQRELKRLGVDIHYRNALSVMLDGDEYRVQCNDGENIRGRIIVVGESTQFENDKSIQRRTGELKDYHHVLISLPASIVRIRNSYVHFVDDGVFHRITFVEDAICSGQLCSFFLVQLRESITKLGSLAGELRRIFGLYGIAESVEGLRIQKVINGKYIPSSANSPWCGYDGRHFFLIRTIGDLSRNVLLMNRELELSKDTLERAVH